MKALPKGRNTAMSSEISFFLEYQHMLHSVTLVSMELKGQVVASTDEHLPQSVATSICDSLKKEQRAYSHVTRRKQDDQDLSPKR